MKVYENAECPYVDMRLMRALHHFRMFDACSASLPYFVPGHVTHNAIIASVEVLPGFAGVLPIFARHPPGFAGVPPGSDRILPIWLCSCLGLLGSRPDWLDSCQAWLRGGSTMGNLQPQEPRDGNARWQ